MFIQPIILNHITKNCFNNHNINFNARARKSKNNKTDSFESNAPKTSFNQKVLTKNEEYIAKNFNSLISMPIVPDNQITHDRFKRDQKHISMINSINGETTYIKHNGREQIAETKYSKYGDLMYHKQVVYHNLPRLENTRKELEFAFNNGPGLPDYYCVERIPAIDFERKISFYCNTPIDVESVNPATGEIQHYNPLIDTAKDFKEEVLKEFLGDKELTKIKKTSVKYFDDGHRYEEVPSLHPVGCDYVRYFRTAPHIKGFIADNLPPKTIEDYYMGRVERNYYAYEDYITDEIMNEFKITPYRRETQRGNRNAYGQYEWRDIYKYLLDPSKIHLKGSSRDIKIDNGNLTYFRHDNYESAETYYGGGIRPIHTVKYNEKNNFNIKHKSIHCKDGVSKNIEMVYYKRLEYGHYVMEPVFCKASYVKDGKTLYTIVYEPESGNFELVSPGNGEEKITI